MKTTIGKKSEITLHDTPINDNLLERFHQDTLSLLPQLLRSQPQINAQADWEAVKSLFSHGVRLVPHLLPGKLASVFFLWRSYQDFKASAEGLQDHHWANALKSFIAGAITLFSLGRLSWESEAETVSSEFAAEAHAPASTATTVQVASRWAKVPPVTPARIDLQTFETSTALQSLKLDANKLVYGDSSTTQKYAAIAGKVYPAVQIEKAWYLRKEDGSQGPSLEEKNSRLVVASTSQPVYRCRSKQRDAAQHEVEENRSIEMYVQARGMTQINRRYPARAFVIQQAVNRAREYAVNCLHNYVTQRDNFEGKRLETVLKNFFEVTDITPSLLSKLEKVIIPVCQELTNPKDDLLYTERFLAGLNAKGRANVVAFVFKQDKQKIIHLTEVFFNPGMDRYTAHLPPRFNVDSHARAVTLIHELSHLVCDSDDLEVVQAMAPYLDLIDTTTDAGKHAKESLERHRSLLSRYGQHLFAVKTGHQVWTDLDQMPTHAGNYNKILSLTKTTNLADARLAFCSSQSADARIDVMLANADSIALLISEMGRQLDPLPALSSLSSSSDQAGSSQALP